MDYRRNYVAGGTYFFTLVTENRKPYFKLAENCTIFMDAIRYVQKNHPFDLVAYVIMPDHIHMIWTLPEDDSNYSTRLRLVKSYFTRKMKNRPQVQNISRLLKGEQEIWQRRFWEHTCKDDRDLENHIDYLHFNPCKHGFSTEPYLWNYSSFGEFVKNGYYPPNWAENVEKTRNFTTDGELE
jgi:putative transposase